MYNQFRVKIHPLLAPLVHVVMALQLHVLVAKIITTVLALTSLMCGLGSALSPMLSIQCQMLMFVPTTGLKTTQLQCHH
jgi:hypothetical protein